MLLATGLAQAVHDRRLDVRIVVTYELEHPDLIARMPTSSRVGYGFAACDRPSAVRRLLRRFSPLGIVFAETTPRKNLGHALATRSHVLGIGNIEPFDCELGFPADADHAQRWAASLHADPADMLTLLVEAQAEPVMRGLIAGADRRSYWWLHDGSGKYDVASLRRTLVAARPDALLFLSGPLASRYDGDDTVRLSEWDRTPLASGSVILVDEPRWLPAVAAAAQGAHLIAPERYIVWQAAALGCPFTFTPESMTAIDSGFASPGESVEELVGLWCDLANDPSRSRGVADRLRRRFWDERRRAAAAAEALAQRIFEWD